MTIDFSQDTIDWEKLASLCGYTHSTTQRTYSIARRKLREFDEANDSAITARPTGRKSNADASAGSGSGLTTSTFASADNDNGNGNEDDQGTPPKKARKARRNFTPRKRKAEKQEEDSKDGSPATETVADEA